MNERIGKFGGKLKRAVIFVGLFSGIFLVLFWAVNLDVDQFKKNSKEGVGYFEDAKNFGISEFSLADFERWASVNSLSGKDLQNADPDKDGLSNYLEFIHGTDPNNVDTDGDKYSDKVEIDAGYDPDDKSDKMLVADIEIEKININVPMVWSKTEDDRQMLKDLENGVAHFANTSAPGQNGNMIVSGHSSNYIWAKGNYNHIFKNLNDLNKGDIIIVRTIQKNGRVLAYKYAVTEKFISSADDERIFADSKNPTLTLTTCWPIGTTFKRAIIKAEIVK